ncbi:hypothetical protein [Flagellimonas sediminis]|uniref:Lipoprotein n=1 Tax=Flagellimonas sediminis TaxID=2696468 RepID=A0A6I5KPT3_9FLAO|nr:hypothetical protein [Allomuricauda sediminis]NDV41689.1 hypothetical protein [Allomuricauda sediminis]
MKSTLMLVPAMLLMVSCHGQEHKTDQTTENKDKVTMEQPKGDWKVNREFDKDGNLIRYDSIYTWSSSDYADKLDRMDKDSLLQSFTSRFSGSFSPFNEEDFHSFFADDSLFTQRFFKEDFFESPIGKDFMDLDEIQKRMMDMQKKFLEQYGQKPETQEPKQS